MTTCCMCGLKTSRDDGLCSPCRMGSVASEHVDRSETDRDPMNYDVACVIREGDMGTRAEDHRRPTATDSDEWNALADEAAHLAAFLDDLRKAARAVVDGRVPAVSAELEGSTWKHSRIADSLTDALREQLDCLDRIEKRVGGWGHYEQRRERATPSDVCHITTSQTISCSRGRVGCDQDHRDALADALREILRTSTDGEAMNIAADALGVSLDRTEG